MNLHTHNKYGQVCMYVCKYVCQVKSGKGSFDAYGLQMLHDKFIMLSR